MSIKPQKPNNQSTAPTSPKQPKPKKSDLFDHVAVKIRLVVDDDTARVLDSQSKICNWLYNHLLQICIDDYKLNENKNQYLKNTNLRNYIGIVRETHPFINCVYNTCLRSTPDRIKKAYERFFETKKGYPKFKSWKKKWFSLKYDRLRSGYFIEGNDQKILRLTLGKNKEGKQLSVKTTLTESFVLGKDDRATSCTIVKNLGDFYAVFNVEKPKVVHTDVVVQGKKSKWIAFDPNHKNMMVGYDCNGETVEYSKLPQLRYWDRVIDRIKSKRDKCVKKHKIITLKGKGPNGTDKTITIPSTRWKRLDKALTKAFNVRREQIKLALCTLAKGLSQDYDYIVIGDYVSTKGTARFKNMRRSMLNQTPIGKIRNTIAWSQKKSGKLYDEIDEKNTTSDCCICGHREKKGPEVREFTCVKCRSTLSRDVNSAINIAKKAGVVSHCHYQGHLAKPGCTKVWNYRKCVYQEV